MKKQIPKKKKWVAPMLKIKSLISDDSNLLNQMIEIKNENIMRGMLRKSLLAVLSSVGILYSCDNEKRDEPISNLDHIETVKLDERGFIDKTNWKLTTTDEQNLDSVNVILKNDESEWNVFRDGEYINLFYEFIVDMDVPTMVKGFYFNKGESLDNALKEIELFKSDDNVNWISLGEYELDTSKAKQYLNIEKTEGFRYVKIKVKKGESERETKLQEFAAYPESYAVRSDIFLIANAK